MGDHVRVIGTFETANSFSLIIDDTTEVGKCEIEKSRASMVIVEPHILIPVTSIVKAFPCVRNAHISTLYSSGGDVSYPLVLGNIVHEVF
jgi:hypothetical protein